MRAVIQRVNACSLEIEGRMHCRIGKGLLVFLGIEDADTQDDVEWLTGKIARLRVFGDENGMMNLSVCDVNAEVMVVSQFTLHASTKKGNRPSYIRSAKPEIAIPLYNAFLQSIEVEMNKTPSSGIFGAHMVINLINDGPVTIIIDTKSKE